MKLAGHRVFTGMVLVACAVSGVRAAEAQVEVRPSTGGENAPTASTPELKTVAVVAVAPYEKLLADITQLGTMMGRPEVSQLIEGGFAFFTQGRGPQALDRTQPWGLIVQTDGAAFQPTACLPVKNADDVLAIAKGYGVQVKEASDGVSELVLPNQQSVFFKYRDGWAFAGLSAASLARLPQNPQAVLAELVREYDVAARIAMKDVPEMYRQFAVQSMQAGMQQRIERRDDESEEQYQLRQQVAESQMEQTMRTLNETESITIGWTIDAEQQRTYVDYTQQFLPGSKMADQLSAYGGSRTNFAGFYQPDAAATFTFATQADPSAIQQDIKHFEATMKTLRTGVNSHVDRSDAKDPEAVKAALSDWFDALEATIRSAQMDGGAALYTRSDSLRLVAGVRVKDTAKIESGLKKLAEAASARFPEFAGVQWDAATHAGVRFHTMTLPVPPELEAPRKMLGSEVKVAVGIGAESVYLAVGDEGLDAVQKAIDASAAEPNKAVPPFELALSLGPIMEAAAAQAEPGSQQQIALSVAELLRNEAQGRDHIRAVGQMVPNGLRYRFVAEEGALRAVGAAATEAQRQALQAQQ